MDSKDSVENAVVDDTPEAEGKGVARCDDDASSVGEKRNVYAVAACLIAATVGTCACNACNDDDDVAVTAVAEAYRRLSRRSACGMLWKAHKL